MSDNLIGHVEIPLGNLKSIGTIDQWFQIFDKKRKLAGEIKMKIFFEGQKTGQNHGAIGKQILHQNLGQYNMMQAGANNAAMMQQQMMMQQQHQQQQMEAQRQAMLQQQQQQAQLQAQLQQQQQQQMMQQQAGMMSNNMYGGMQPMGMPPMRMPMQQAVQQQRMSVTIPYGVMGGQQIIINVPGKGQMMVTVPMGMQAGQSFQVAV